MSDAENLIFDIAKNKAKIKVQKHWNDFMRDPQTACMWKEYRVTINNTWVDPWNERELSGIEDVAPDYEITQNYYMLWNWFRGHGYCDYTIAAILASANHESTATGGSWERRYNPRPVLLKHPYQNLLTFDAESTNGEPYGWQWYQGGGAPLYNGSNIDWTAYFTDYSGRVWSKSAASNSWDAVLAFDILTEIIQVPGQARPVEMPVGYESGQLQWKRVWRPDGRGYGFVQFTPWTKLPRVCKYALLHGDEYFTDAAKHWQLSLTLQLMIFEKQREIAMATPPSQQTGGDYIAEWTDSNSATYDGGAWFQWPFNPQNTYNRHYYNSSCTWDQFASGAYIPWILQEIQNMQNPPTDSADINWCIIQLAMSIWRTNYIHTPYADYGYQQSAMYAYRAITYWNQNGGPNIRDVPRARDLPYCELDKYHLTKESFPAIIAVMRRRKKNVRTLYV